MARNSPARELAEREAAAAAGKPADDAGAGASPKDPEPPGPIAAAADAKAERRNVIDEPLERFMPPKVRTALGLDGNDAAAQLLAEACFVFGIDPNPKLKPKELMSFRYDQGEPDGAPPIPPTVTLVTCGGLKVKFPIDADSEHKLRIVYNAYRVDAKTGEKVVLPLPPDLTLPREYVDGLVRTAEHQYRTGYLKSGGKAEGDRKAKIAELRAAGKLG